MPLDALKKEILDMVRETDEEEVLNLVKEELAEYKLQAAGFDATDLLSEEDRSELKQMVEEDPLHDTISFEELQSKIKEWRSK